MSSVARVSVFLVLLGSLMSLGSALAQGGQGQVVVGEVRGVINPVMAGYVERLIGDAETAGAAAVVLRLDTPGGLVDSMREINQRILAARVPVIVYVAPDGARAGSAGAFITYAAHVAAMAPTTNIGSATPVSMGENGEQQLSEEMRAKLNNDAVAQIRALAEQRGRNADFAERAVREGANLGAREALEQNVVDVVATDVADLLRQLDGRTVKLATGEVTLRTADAAVTQNEMTPLEQFFLTITNPTIAYILLSLGSLGLLVELYNPGAVFPGVAGGIALLLAFYALGTLPLNFAGLALMGFGVFLFALEPFVGSANGVLATGGAIAFGIGSLMLVNVPASAEYLRVAPLAIAAVTGLMLLLGLVMVTFVLRSQRRRAVTGREGLVNQVGVARTAVLPDREGTILLHGEWWRAISSGGAIAPGQSVEVERVQGLLLFVRPSNVLV